MKTKYVPILCIPQTLQEFDNWMKLNPLRKKFQKILRIYIGNFGLEFDLPALGVKRRRSQSLLLNLPMEQSNTYLNATFVVHNNHIVAEYRNTSSKFDFSQFICDQGNQQKSIKNFISRFIWN